MEHTFTVTVEADDIDDAIMVMRERLDHDEQYDFDYALSWDQPTFHLTLCSSHPTASGVKWPAVEVTNLNTLAASQMIADYAKGMTAGEAAEDSAIQGIPVEWARESDRERKITSAFLTIRDGEGDEIRSDWLY